MSIEETASGFMGVGCVILGFLAMIFVVSGAWIGLPILFFLGLIMVFVIGAISSTIEWVAKLFGYDPDKKTPQQEEADRILAEIRTDVAQSCSGNRVRTQAIITVRWTNDTGHVDVDVTHRIFFAFNRQTRCIPGQ